jgi:predicted RNA binding protein YcfA (HicA-like mRNA interferase family)
MKREALLAHLRSHGCEMVREGGSHSIWRNPVTGEIQAVPRHKKSSDSPPSRSAAASA